MRILISWYLLLSTLESIVVCSFWSTALTNTNDVVSPWAATIIVRSLFTNEWKMIVRIVVTILWDSFLLWTFSESEFLRLHQLVDLSRLLSLDFKPIQKFLHFFIIEWFELHNQIMVEHLSFLLKLVNRIYFTFVHRGLFATSCEKSCILINECRHTFDIRLLDIIIHYIYLLILPCSQSFETFIRKLNVICHIFFVFSNQIPKWLIKNVDISLHSFLFLARFDSWFKLFDFHIEFFDENWKSLTVNKTFHKLVISALWFHHFQVFCLVENFHTTKLIRSSLFNFELV